jgi:copper(I)-binding protein
MNNNKRVIMNIVRTFGVGLIATLSLFAHDAQAQQNRQITEAPITIENVWSPPTLGSQRIGVVYFKLTNKQSFPVTVTGASSPVSERAELHTHLHDNGVMQMRSLPNITLQPGESVTFEPGKKHIMLMELEVPLNKGSRFPLRLRTENGKEYEFKVPVISRSVAMQLYNMDHTMPDASPSASDVQKIDEEPKHSHPHH